MFRQNFFIAHLYTSFGEMSPHKCELLQFSCIHKFFSFVKCPKTLNHEDGEMRIRAMWRGWQGGGVRVRGHRARALSSLSRDPALAPVCGHVLFRDILTSCILLLEEGNWTGM